jgi:hypothetical protein
VKWKSVCNEEIVTFYSCAIRLGIILIFEDGDAKKLI